MQAIRCQSHVKVSLTLLSGFPFSNLEAAARFKRLVYLAGAFLVLTGNKSARPHLQQHLCANIGDQSYNILSVKSKKKKKNSCRIVRLIS